MNKKAIADRDWRDGDPAAPKTPWGPAQDAYQIARGVIWYSTAGHGGLAISQNVARTMLTPAALLEGERWGAYYWYEEDIAYVIPFYEHPEWDKEFARKAGGRGMSKAHAEESIKHWFPKYFENLAKTDLKHPERLRIGDKVKVLKDITFRNGVTFKEGDILTVLKSTPSKISLDSENGGWATYTIPASFYSLSDQRIVKVANSKEDRMGDTELLKAVTKLASDKPELRKHLVPFLKEAAENIQADIEAFKEASYHFPKITKQRWDTLNPIQKYAVLKKNAHKAVLAPMGLDEAAIRSGRGAMMYNIDAGSNKSKFYESVIVPQNGGYRVISRWGALTDSPSAGRVDGGKFDYDDRFFFDSEFAAKRAIQQIKSKRYSHGYQDVNQFKGGQGWYPVGLNRDVGFGWGTQQVAVCIPSMKRLQAQLLMAQKELQEDGYSDSLKDALETAFEAVRDLKDSEMGQELVKQIGNPLRRLTPIMQSRFKNPLDAKKLLAAVNGMLRFLDAQLKHC